MHQRRQGQSNSQHCFGRTTDENNFDIGRSTPIMFQAIGGYSESPLPRQQSFCMSRPNLAGFTEARFDVRDGEHCVSQAMQIGGQHYLHPTTSSGSAPVYTPEPALLNENWGFQPDPNIEGHWTVVPQSHGPPPDQQQTAQMKYPMNYPEQPNEFQYEVSILYDHYLAKSYTDHLQQMHLQAPDHSAYPSPLESYLVPRSYSPSSSMSSPYVGSSQTAAGCWYPVFQQILVKRQSAVGSPGYMTPSSSSGSTEQSADDMHVPGNMQKRTSSAKSRIRSAQLFQCRYCQERFAKKGNRNDHERTHDNDKPRVACTEHGCLKDFGRPADLARHKRSVCDADPGQAHT